MPNTICAVCDKPEQECGCDRYCCICMGQYAIRLCMDGLYYCPACAEGCEATVANPGEEAHRSSSETAKRRF